VLLASYLELAACLVMEDGPFATQTVICIALDVFMSTVPVSQAPKPESIEHADIPIMYQRRLVACTYRRPNQRWCHEKRLTGEPSRDTVVPVHSIPTSTLGLSGSIRAQRQLVTPSRTVSMD
jgi:hypothetical protein